MRRFEAGAVAASRPGARGPARRAGAGTLARRVALSLWVLACGAILASALAREAHAERVKDIASVAGVRENQLIGYGLVVGLAGTGDSATQVPFTAQSLKNMLRRMGVALPSTRTPTIKNVAAVAVHATLPAFAKPGQTIDVTVSTIGDAKSLRGGTLIMSPLKGIDGGVYAIAQGNVVVGGFGAASQGSSVTVNIPTVGRIPSGATVERPAPTVFDEGDFVYLNLHQPDFTTAERVAEALNRKMGRGVARANDAGTVRVSAPRDPGQRVDFLSIVENIELTPGEAPARVIVNARSGTVVIGQHVRVSPAAVAHGNLSVTISNTTQVSQPAPLAGGTTAVVPKADVAVSEEHNKAFVFNPGVSLDEIVRAINRVGASPNDLVAILEALKEAGALRAELIVI